MRESELTDPCQFDDIDLSKAPNQTLTKLPYMEFIHFEVLNTTAAFNNGMLHKGDLDCASSWPNALHSIPQTVPAPSIFKTNGTALAATNMSQYFDLSVSTFTPSCSGSRCALIKC